MYPSRYAYLEKPSLNWDCFEVDDARTTLQLIRARRLHLAYAISGLAKWTRQAVRSDMPINEAEDLDLGSKSHLLGVVR